MSDTKSDTLDLNFHKHMAIYELVEMLLAIGQTERVITMAMDTGNIAIYNTKDGEMHYIGYVDITKSTFVTVKIDE